MKVKVNLRTFKARLGCGRIGKDGNMRKQVTGVKLAKREKIEESEDKMKRNQSGGKGRGNCEAQKRRT